MSLWTQVHTNLDLALFSNHNDRTKYLSLNNISIYFSFFFFLFLSISCRFVAYFFPRYYYYKFHKDISFIVWPNRQMHKYPKLFLGAIGSHKNHCWIGCVCACACAYVTQARSGCTQETNHVTFNKQTMFPKKLHGIFNWKFTLYSSSSSSLVITYSINVLCLLLKTCTISTQTRTDWHWVECR